MWTERNRKNAEGVIGLAKRAGALCIGTEQVVAEVRKGRAKLVLIASDVSENTAKRLTDKADYRRVPWERIPPEMRSLGRLVGREYASAVAFTQEGFVLSYRKAVRDCPSEALTNTLSNPERNEDADGRNE